MCVERVGFMGSSCVNPGQWQIRNDPLWVFNITIFGNKYCCRTCLCNYREDNACISTPTYPLKSYSIYCYRILTTFMMYLTIHCYPAVFREFAVWPMNRHSLNTSRRGWRINPLSFLLKISACYNIMYHVVCCRWSCKIFVNCRKETTVRSFPWVNLCSEFKS